MKLWKTYLSICAVFILFNFTRISFAQEKTNIAPEQANHLVVLQYHHVADDTPGITSIRPNEFIEHLNYLADNQFNIVDLPSALNKIQNGQPLPKNAVAITFDDGYLNLIDVALPELEKRNWPATIFVNPGLLEKHKSHYLSWQQLKHWHNKGMAIANHGWQHDYWVRQPKDMDMKQWQAHVKDSILSTEKAIEQQIGGSPKMVAFPYGEYDSWLTTWLTEQNLIAFGQQSGVIASYSDFTALPRFPASGQYANLQTLAVKLKSKALPVDYKTLPSPLKANTQNPPQVNLNWLTKGKINAGQLNCFVTSQPKAKVTDKADYAIVVATEKLNTGRSRYNCTLPRNDGSGDYFWFSQPWLVE
ncbi:polysaccharide deacetylase family protein [Catenovulum sp. 2E275]|uniref:polysaccharide deacetylase family protein n=1 Tax=Catenovulum sp. 2E275 TaxID=2980497 RepID=UPI0021D0CE0C|nr:polysaccharide deacetylase family protein [Catenovulum sp. 2E275]MCU4677675.1 polysaccharide deacetylase family protein [Catenovulum sp. 2E275]